MIRISGPGAFRICGACIRQHGRFEESPPRHVCVYDMISPGTDVFVDRVCAAKFAKPSTYTGEDMVEITCHGGDIVPSLVMKCLRTAGAVAAGPGEFTRRAVEAGKMDALSAEATLAVVQSVSEESHARAALYCDGQGGSAVAALAGSLLELASAIEAGIETDGLEGVGVVQAREELSGMCASIRGELERWRSGMCSGGRVVIAGLANAGKSTLFNLLVGAERVLVDRKPGTTRDYVGEWIRIGSTRLEVLDTAGFAGSDDEVGRASEMRSRALLQEASRVVWVSPLDVPSVSGEERGLLEGSSRGVIVVQSKEDREEEGTRRGTIEGSGLPCIAGNLTEPGSRRKVKEWVTRQLGSGAEEYGAQGLVMNARQEGVLHNALAEGEAVLRDRNAQMDVLADGVRRMAVCVRGLDAREGGEELLGRILAGFCVGK